MKSIGVDGVSRSGASRSHAGLWRTSSSMSASRIAGIHSLNPYEHYDDGYEAIYDDGEYDEDRYDSDPEYAEGVDDAMDELDEDG